MIDVLNKLRADSLPGLFIFFFIKLVAWIQWRIGLTPSFSSDGEDVALKKIFNGVENGTYIDIGCNHPIRHSNTFGLYLRGWRGVCVDPLPFLKNRYRLMRPRDTFYNAGVSCGSSSSREQDFFYYATWPDNSTFDESRVEELKNRFDRMPSAVFPVQLMTINEISGYEQCGSDIHLLNLDTEGFELEILMEFFSCEIFPWVICVEELGVLSEHVSQSRIQQLIGNKYVIIVKTLLSSIYVRRDVLSVLPSLHLRDFDFESIAR